MKLLKIYSFLFVTICCLSGGKIAAQELNAQVQVITSSIQATNKQVFTTLETSMREFLNNRKWTDEKYAPEERIRCQFILNVTDYSPGKFKGDLQVLYSRPIYRSGYDSPVLVHRDNQVSFEYLEYDRLDFALNANLSNLTSLLAYYTYIIIGLDHDTYAPLGGSPYYQNAQTIVGNAQGGRFAGWSSFDGNRNRFWLLDNLTSPAFEPFRISLYNYHRKGLDIMYDPSKQKRAKETIKSALIALEEVNNKRRNSMVMQIFFDAKNQEIVNIFSGGEPIPLAELKESLLELDANNASKYEPMGKS